VLARRSGRLGGDGSTSARLHAKVAVIDRSLIFIGSINLDSRSSMTNTEMGLVVDGPEMGKAAAAQLSKALHSGAYELRLSADQQRIEWLDIDREGQPAVNVEEPELNAWERL
jgi:cardiolipin synthase C